MKKWVCFKLAQLIKTAINIRDVKRNYNSSQFLQNRYISEMLLYNWLNFVNLQKRK